MTVIVEAEDERFASEIPSFASLKLMKHAQNPLISLSTKDTKEEGQ